MTKTWIQKPSATKQQPLYVCDSCEEPVYSAGVAPRLANLCLDCYYLMRVAVPARSAK